MQLSIIIVNYNVKYFLEKCLSSIERAKLDISLEVIVIDNASSDGSLSYLSNRFPSVNFIANKENTGFGKANNQGLHICRGEFVLFLNPDTIVPEDALHKCIEFMDQHPEAGACGVRMIDGTGRYLPESKRGFPSLSTAFFKLSGITARLPHSRKFAAYYLGHLPEKEVNEVDVLAGAFLMIRKNVLNLTGGFDEAFFMYGEDIDLSYRIQKAGWKNYYYPLTTIIHFKGESTKKGDLDYVHMFYKAMSIFVKKHYGQEGSGLFPLLIQLAITLRAVPTAIKTLFPLKRRVKEKGIIHSTIVAEPGAAEKLITLMSKIKPDRKFSLTEEVPSVVQSKEIEEIIFSEGLISYKDMISAMQSFPAGTVFRFYDATSNVVIGSDSKNKSGVVIV